MKLVTVFALAALSCAAQFTPPPNGGTNPGTVTSVTCPNGTITTSGTCSPISGATTGALVTASSANGLQTPNASTTAFPMNTWTANLDNQWFYFEGSSITRAPHSGGSPVGTQLSGGGLSGNYGNLLSVGNWGSGHSTYYNDAVDGSTSTAMLARYTTGNNTYGGVTVPSPHSICAAATTASERAFFFVDTTVVNNDQLNSISVSTTVSNYNTLYTDAHADGCIVVLVLAPGQNFGAGNTINQDVRDGVISSDMWVSVDLSIPNQFDNNYWDSTDNSHPNVAGHVAMERVLESHMRNGGNPQQNFSGPGYFTTPVCVQSADSNTNSACLNTGGTGAFPSGASFSGTQMTNVPLMTWATYGSCSLAFAFCAESGQWTPDSPIIIKKIQVYLNSPPAGCTFAGTLLLQANGGGGTTLLSIPMVNGTQSYSVSGPVSVASGNVLTVQNSSTAATGCSTYASTFGNTVEYIMQ